MTSMDDDDDFYGDDDDHTSQMNNREAIRSQSNIFPLGYQDGIEIGKEQTLQRGFNAGLTEATLIAYKWSLLLGLISSMDVFYHHNKQFANTEHTPKLQDMENRLKTILNQHCSTPSIDLLKSKFIGYTHVDEVETTNKRSNGSCCSDSNNNNNNNGNNCNEANGDSCCKSEQKQQPQQQDDDDGCCKGNNKDDDAGCCKVQSKVTSPSSKAMSSPHRALTQEDDKALFEQLCNECKSLISLFGLDGNKIVNQVLVKQFNVINATQ
ncbi:hypothetical protein SAMD00019534_044640 [Acytostelium subglobosum LB1]|uniref:hypothetical protein n=1 Tax=Acytostelium subglobosum LB1 TaxID=1410327 RepID=UPI00064520C7|nr:hypothetical protein SAMD00019534_044640 [Acytostelium subglobosum LB1]GAM21289.1 hypothetical protein SAMD00019534_044640 [Acytostelium subglobosum LB1]|eukprot:XP_012755408.1 hypothetical protein SAMD00019534_044640 [Acytostelium subglobosum LB1]